MQQYARRGKGREETRGGGGIHNARHTGMRPFIPRHQIRAPTPPLCSAAQAKVSLFFSKHLWQLPFSLSLVHKVGGTVCPSDAKATLNDN